MTKRSFQYANYKTQATSFMDIALLVANVSQLRFLIEMPEFTPRVILALTLVSLSIVLQTGVGIVLINICKDEQKKIQGMWRQNSEKGRERRSITPPIDSASLAEAEKVPQDETDAVSTSSSDSEERIDMHETINITEHDDLDEPDAGHNVIMMQDGARYTGKWRQNSEKGRERRSITPPIDSASPAETEKVPQDETDAVSTSSSDSEERIDMHETINITEHDDEPDAGYNVIMMQDGATYTATADEPDNEEKLTAVDHVDGPDEEMGVVVIVNEPCFDEFCEHKTEENFWVRNGIFIIMVVNIILGGLELSASKDVIFQSMPNGTHA